jgi:serine/threonine protein kinase
MAITIGTRIGSHEITELLGKGGMGEVYRARDNRLKRDVALKVLPDEFSEDADRIRRFQHEAQLLASLNHPNIAQIYGLEESGGTRCIVMELVEGETIQERLKRGPIPVEEVLTIAKQIAEALEAAHERGIIHRDLKPANIKLTPDSRVKMLDFGLAKAEIQVLRVERVYPRPPKPTFSDSLNSGVSPPSHRPVFHAIICG